MTHASSVVIRASLSSIKSKNHVGSAFTSVCFDDRRYSQEPIIYRANNRDEDVGQIFVEMIEENIKKVYEKFDSSKEMIFKDEDKHEFNDATYCWICKRLFDDDNDKVRDHSHFTGKYREVHSCHLSQLGWL